MALKKALGVENIVEWLFGRINSLGRSFTPAPSIVSLYTLSRPQSPSFSTCHATFPFRVASSFVQTILTPLVMMSGVSRDGRFQVKRFAWNVLGKVGFSYTSNSKAATFSEAQQLPIACTSANDFSSSVAPFRGLRLHLKEAYMCHPIWVPKMILYTWSSHHARHW